MATKVNLVMEQGATFSATLNLTDTAQNPLNLGGYTANSQMKKWYTSLTAYTFNTFINNSSGTITLEMDANSTVLINHGRYVYDVFLTDASNVVSRVVEGIVTVTPGVSHISTETTPNTYNSNVNFVTIPLNG